MAVSRLVQTTLQNGFEKYNSIWDGRSAVGAFETIASFTLISAQSSVEFTSIPGTYSHLQIRGISFANYRTGIRFNSDTGSNYSYHLVGGYGSSTPYSVGAASSNGSSTTIAVVQSGGSSPAALIIDILDYANTNKNKTVKCLSGFEANGSGEVWLGSANWRNTNAITSIMLMPTEGGSNFGQYSSFSLYGVK